MEHQINPLTLNRHPVNTPNLLTPHRLELKELKPVQAKSKAMIVIKPSKIQFPSRNQEKPKLSNGQGSFKSSTRQRTKSSPHQQLGLILGSVQKYEKELKE